MTNPQTTRQAYEAYLRGAATLDEVSLAANRVIAAHLRTTGRGAQETAAMESDRGPDDSQVA